MKRILYIFITLLLISAGNSMAQKVACDSVVNDCQKNMTKKYISDGQHYKSMLIGSEVAEFESTFFGSTTYRISACSSLGEGNLIFRIFDKEKNLLFTNEEFKNSPYWDFKFVSTLDCTIEAQLLPGKAESGCAVMLISFKK
jgi:hypothetical protein